MAKSELDTKQGSFPLTVDHVTDFYRRYPGEMVTFHTRVGIHRPLPGVTLRVTTPAGLILNDYQTPAELGDMLPVVTVEDEARHVIWQVTEEVKAGTVWEFQVRAQVAPAQRDTTLESRALVTARITESELISAKETAVIDVSAKAKTLQHLPALYQADDFVGRFLMLFESFWSPIEQQIDHASLYVDPKLCPPDFLPWLASWLNLVLDERLREERQRQLIQLAVSLYRRRGTRQGLLDYLEIYTGVRAHIIEHRAKDFRLGPEARLGPGVALGAGNQPHTFTITLRLPPIVDGDAHERARRDQERRRAIEAIIQAEKPAHTAYTLRIETLSDQELRAANEE